MGTVHANNYGSQHPNACDWWAGGFEFVGNTLDGHLRAFDVANGMQVWLPTGTSSGLQALAPEASHGATVITIVALVASFVLLSISMKTLPLGWVSLVGACSCCGPHRGWPRPDEPFDIRLRNAHGIAEDSRTERAR